LNSNFFLHLHPRKVPADALRFTLTWGLGGAAALMIVLQLFTGLLLNFAYEPSPVQAYQSVQHIETNLFLGRLVRNMHHWTGHFLVIVSCLHLLRIFFNGAYFAPRRSGWYSGLMLLLLVLVANFTGYLLPWDQLAFWAVTIATSMLSYLPFVGEFLQELILGGTEVGGVTLRMFHSLHATLLPFTFLVCMSYHFWRIRKTGGIKVDVKGRRTMLPVVPELLVREFAFSAVVICVLVLFGMFFDAPLIAMANPELTPETIKAPWYFLWLQELLLHMQPVLALCILPLAFTSFLLLLPFLGQRGGRPSIPVQITFIVFILVIVVLTTTGIWFRGPGMKLIFPWWC
jgi:quinol-cytochrome oxidoreductase complex cytochrome b subunit